MSSLLFVKIYLRWYPHHRLDDEHIESSFNLFFSNISNSLTLVWEDGSVSFNKKIGRIRKFLYLCNKKTMIKKTKDAYKQIAEKVTEALEYNKTHTTQYSRINLTTLNISRGLYNNIIKNGIVVAVYNVCQELGISAKEPPFEIQLYDNGDYCQMYLRF